MEALLNEISYTELLEWQAYDEVSPPFDDRADYNAAAIQSTIANVNRAKTQQPFKPEDFLLRYEVVEEKRPEMSPAEVERNARLWMDVFQRRKERQ